MEIFFKIKKKSKWIEISNLKLFLKQSKSNLLGGQSSLRLCRSQVGENLTDLHLKPQQSFLHERSVKLYRH